jgi:hypothetical protein
VNEARCRAPGPLWTFRAPCAAGGMIVAPLPTTCRYAMRPRFGLPIDSVLLTPWGLSTPGGVYPVSKGPLNAPYNYRPVSHSGVSQFAVTPCTTAGYEEATCLPASRRGPWMCAIGMNSPIATLFIKLARESRAESLVAIAVSAWNQWCCRENRGLGCLSRQRGPAEARIRARSSEISRPVNQKVVLFAPTKFSPFWLTDVRVRFGDSMPASVRAGQAAVCKNVVQSHSHASVAGTHKRRL